MVVVILENLGLTEKGINYLTTISYRFTSGNIYGLIGDTSVNVFVRVLCKIYTSQAILVLKFTQAIVL